MARAATGVLSTGQTGCYDARGREIACIATRMDGESRSGLPWPEPRFVLEGERVRDRLTGLDWSRDASLHELPLTWREALEFIARLNGDRFLGSSDWRLPNRRELRSLISHRTRRPPLPEGHPFINVFAGWYWSSTTAAIAPAHAWYVDMDGGRMFYGGKDQSFMVWPVRGESEVLPRTGADRCFDDGGHVMDCAGSGQDAEYRMGLAWPTPRFEVREPIVVDRLTGLAWDRNADRIGAVAWEAALAAVAQLGPGWRLPNINELESLVDGAHSRPALPGGHPFARVRDVYWSSTTSMYEPDWAWALYLDKGAIGVGQKEQARFHVWAVRDRP